MNHLDAMRLQAQNLEQAAHSHYDASRVTSKINSVATSLVASAIQSRNFTEMNTPQPKTPRSRSRSISVSRYVYVFSIIIIVLNYIIYDFNLLWKIMRDVLYHAIVLFSRFKLTVRKKFVIERECQ